MSQVVWITGASSGIGEALAYEWAKRGAKLVLSSRNEKLLEEVRSRCAHPDRHLVQPLDLGALDTLPAVVEKVLGKVGAVDVVIHSGGISQRGLVKDTSLEVDRRLMEVNYFGTVALTKTLLPSMLARGKGHFVPISSLTGKFGTPLRSGYAASKHALHGFFDSLRAELGAQGIRVTIVCPGYIRTNVSLNALTADGSPQGTLDNAQANGLSAEACAEQTIRAIDRGLDEVYIGGKERFGVLVKRFLPGVFNRLISRVPVT